VRRYSVVLFPDLEDGGYTALVPTLPGCITEGDTLEDVLAMARDAIRLYIADLEAHGETVPEEPVSAALATVEV
jgi:antitoxin HicB